jgi:hypothetical protein
LQSHTTQACNHIPNNQVAFQPHRQSQVLQPHITPGCNHVRQIVAITHWFSSFFIFCSTEINQQFLQSHTTQACNHIPNNQVVFQLHRQSQVFLQPHITSGCNHAHQLVAITHWFSYFFLFAAVINQQFLQSHTTQACNHIPNNQVAFQPHRQSQVFLQPHITPGCNHAHQIVTITHWFSSFFFLQSQK